VSTTLTQTGAVLGIGLSDRSVNGVNWPVFFKIFAGWILNVVVASLAGAAIVSIGAQSPNTKPIIREQLSLGNETSSI
jgi:phosphate/sulfate permease